ncbi:hypothetical protein MMC17_010158 [Xylographa soralifera]|nr:hypothetical protein [Xylographa soralifera]
MSLAIFPTANNQSDLDFLPIAQKAPEFLRQQVEAYSACPIPFINAAESSELWATHEKLIYSCLRIGDDKSAHLCLERLIKRFGASNERVMGLRGLYQEGVAEDDTAFKVIYAEYGRILTDDPTNMPVMKRRIALLQSLGMQSEAIQALVELLQISPTDAEAWVELSALYLAQAMHSQAFYCLEEVLLIYPTAWNVHARLGEVHFISSFSPGEANETSIERALTEAIRRYCRSIELCDGYLRGYYGLKISTDRFLETCYQDNKTIVHVAKDNGSSTRLALDVVKKLNKKATEELQKIVDQKALIDEKYSGYEKSEIISAKALLDQGSHANQIAMIENRCDSLDGFVIASSTSTDYSIPFGKAYATNKLFAAEHNALVQSKLNIAGYWED